MLLWTRTRRTDGLRWTDACASAVGVAEQAAATTGLEVVPWATVYGSPLGTVLYTARVESQAAMAAALTTLAGSGRTLDDGPGEDAIGELVSTAGTGRTTARFASTVRSRCAPGRIAEAMAWGVDILSHASKATGLDGLLLRNLYGRWASLVWISLAESMEEIDDSAAALAADPTYVERIDDAGPLFLPGSASQHLLRRLS
jgi:hypothetical protein